MAVCVVLFTACIDEGYRLDEVSTEVTIGQGTTTVPLGYINNKSIGELLGKTEVDVEGLEVDEEGNYLFTYSGVGEPLSIEGVNHVVEIPAVVSTFEVEYPSFGLVDHAHSFDEFCSIPVQFIDDELFAGQSIPVTAGYTISGHEEASIVHNLEYDVPEQIAGIKAIYLKPMAEGDPGARIDIRFLLNDLASINGGGHITLELNAPEGYKLYDESGHLLENGEFNVSEYDFEAGENELEFVAYIRSMEGDFMADDGKLNIPINLDYHLSFEMVTKAGTLTFNQAPQLHIMSDLAYDDADIVLNEVVLFDHEMPAGGDIEINGMPTEILSIKELTFAEATPLTLYAGGFEWMSEELAESIIIDAWLPDYIILHDDISIGYNADEHKLHTSLNSLRNGITVDLDAIRFEGEGLVPNEGSLELSFAPELVARIAPNTELKLSMLEHEGAMTLEAGIEAATIDIESVSGKVDYQYTYSQEFELKGLDNLDLQVNQLSVSPVLMINVENPLTISATFSATIVPKCGGVFVQERAVVLEGIVIDAADYVGGEVVPATTHLVLAPESKRAEYEGEDVLFVACNIDALLEGELPSGVIIDMELSTNSEEYMTLYAADSYVVNYDYALKFPLSLNERFDVVYSGSVANLGNLFADIASIEGVRIGDVAVILEVVNTTPLAFGLEAEFVDEDGNPTDVQVRIPEGVLVEGSADGVSEALSTIRLELILDNGDITKIASIDGLNFTLEAQSMAETEVPLNENQYVGAAAKLELSGGITLDLKEINR